jgi:hypothetical protein
MRTEMRGGCKGATVRLESKLERLPKVVGEKVALEAARMRKLVRVLQDRARLREEFFMTEPDERLGGEPPVDLLRRGRPSR